MGEKISLTLNFVTGFESRKGTGKNQDVEVCLKIYVPNKENSSKPMLRTGITGKETNWDYSKRLFNSRSRDAVKNEELREFLNECKQYAEELREKSGVFSAQELKNYIVSRKNEVEADVVMSSKRSDKVLDYIKLRLQEEKAKEKGSNWICYRATLNSFSKFLGVTGREMRFRDVKPYIMDAYMNTLTKKDARRLIYRTLVAVWNDAIRNDVKGVPAVKDTFKELKHYRKIIEIKQKRDIVALSEEQELDVFNFDLETVKLKNKEYLLDLYRFGLLTAMNIEDIAELKESNVTANGHLYYVRAKTGAVIDIPMSCDVKEIIERRKGNGYLFDVYEKLGTYDKKYNRKKAVNDRCNQLLNLISAELGLGFVLNFSVARRTCITRWMRESNNNYVLASKKAGTSPEYINKHYYNVDESVIDEIITNRTLKRA